MRARNLKPGFFGNPVLNSLPAHHRLLFLGLSTICDRRGLIEDRPRKIHDTLLVGIDVDTDAALHDLATVTDDDGTTLITRYVCANGVRAIKLNNFLRHNNPHVRERDNPLLDEPEASTGPALGQPRASTGLAQGQPALTPDSGLLTPDSGLLKEEEDARERAVSSPPEANPDQTGGDPGDGTLEPEAIPADIRALMAGTANALGMDPARARRRPAAERTAPDVATAVATAEAPAPAKPGPLPATKTAPAGPPPTPPARPATAPPDDDPGPGPAHAAAYRLAEYLHEIDPAITAPPIIDTWALQLSRLHHRDKRPWREVAEVMHWAFRVNTWWAPKLLNPANFCRHYAQMRAQWMTETQTEAKPKEPADPQHLRTLYESLDFEVAEGGPDAARAWIATQPEAMRAKLAKRLGKLTATQGAS